MPSAVASQHPDSPCSFPESYLGSRICSTAFPLPCSAPHHCTQLPAFPPPALHNSSALQHYQKPHFPALFPLQHHSPHCSAAAAPQPPWSPQLCSRLQLFTAALQKSSGSATSLQCSVAQPNPGAPNLTFSPSLLFIQTRLHHH